MQITCRTAQIFWTTSKSFHWNLHEFFCNHFFTSKILKSESKINDLNLPTEPTQKYGRQFLAMFQIASLHLSAVQVESVLKGFFDLLFFFFKQLKGRQWFVLIRLWIAFIWLLLSVCVTICVMKLYAVDNGILFEFKRYFYFNWDNNKSKAEQWKLSHVKRRHSAKQFQNKTMWNINWQLLLTFVVIANEHMHDDYTRNVS